MILAYCSRRAAGRALRGPSLHLFVCCLNSEESCWSRWDFPVWCSGGRRPWIAGCVSLQRLGVGLHLTRPAWESNLVRPASEIASLTTELSVQLASVDASEIALYAQFPTQDSCLFGARPWQILNQHVKQHMILAGETLKQILWMKFLTVKLGVP